MAYTDIDNPAQYFSTTLYTGNAVDGSGTEQAVTGVGFQPDWVWIKSRGATKSHYFFDVVRGVTKELNSNNNNDENTNTQGLKSFDSDGFTLGSEPEMNENNTTYVSWNWKAGTAISSASTGGSGTAKTYSGTVDTTAGISVITYVGNGADNHQVPHHLGAVPKMFIMKNRSRDSRGWNVYHHTQTANNGALLNSTDAYGGDGSMLNNVEPTSVYVNLGDSSETNQNDDNHIM